MKLPFSTYLVGGAVRDRLLGLPVTDRDYVVVGATPDDLIGAGFKQVGADFPVFLHPDSGDEYALARTERKTARGYHGFAVHFSPDVTLEEDLQRRDLTINAMAQAPDGSVIDPYGGQADLAARRLRHVSPAFAEDPVRILRLARFAARFHRMGFTVADDTQALMRRMVAAGEVDALVPERVWQEFERALREPDPQRFIGVLRDCGALAKLLPELDRLFGVPQPAGPHPEIDTGVHVLMVLAQAARLSDDPQVRFAALLHDLGKGTTPPGEWPSHHGHEARSVELVSGLCARLKVPVAYRQLAQAVARDHGNAHRALELRPDTLLEIIERTDALRRPQRFAQFLLACEADHRGRTGYADRPYPQAARLQQAFEAARGVDVRPLVERGLTGEAMRSALRQARARAIAAAIKVDE
ncbi:multifunctional CCA addition/repair protein [Immundisolibacter sp.]|uniref:multifunctional CCA addition/repair protein n=1 Tax=Immundisolibacter sp. TaxID=1934948 RepID=UPI003F8510D6